MAYIYIYKSKKNEGEISLPKMWEIHTRWCTTWYGMNFEPSLNVRSCVQYSMPSNRYVIPPNEDFRYFDANAEKKVQLVGKTLARVGQELKERMGSLLNQGHEGEIWFQVSISPPA